MQKLELLTSIHNLSSIVNNTNLTATMSTQAVDEINNNLETLLLTYLEKYCD